MKASLLGTPRTHSLAALSAYEYQKGAINQRGKKIHVTEFHFGTYVDQLFQRIVNGWIGVRLDVDGKLCTITTEDWGISTHVPGGDQRFAKDDELPWGLSLSEEEQGEVLESAPEACADMQAPLTHPHSNSAAEDYGRSPLDRQMDQGPPPSSFQHHPAEDTNPQGLRAHPQESGAAQPSGLNQSQGGSPTANGSLDANGDRDGASQGSRATTATAPYDSASAAATANAYKNKTNKTQKIYVGNLPNTTREDDLQGCFGEMGRIVGVELKIGYGFVEFENKEQAERAVQKYDGGLFLGNKIRCEVSHGGGKVAKFGEPGACFKCRQQGHWARECPNEAVDPNWRDNWKPPSKKFNDHQARPAPPPNDDLIQPPMRNGYRDDYPPARLPPRDYRPDPSAREMRDYRSVREGRPLSPPMLGGRPPYPRDYDDYRGGPPPRGPPGLPAMSNGPYDSRGAPLTEPRAYDMRPPYDSRPPPMYGGSEYDRAPPPVSRGGDYGPPPGPPLSAGGYDRSAGPYGGSAPYGNGRARSPPAAFDARRDYGPPSGSSYEAYRGRGPPPPAGPPAGRYDAYSRRRSMSPPTRSGNGYYESGPPPVGPPAGYGGNGREPYGRSQGDYPPAGYYDGPPSGYRGGASVGPRDDGPDRRYADARMGGGYDRR
ncbi:hypothetical protein FRB90_008841 [Tulasnella sp. 427]|nr:hypothetical protein FRB90_008841 [Tulasnella sp. 427]